MRLYGNICQSYANLCHPAVITVVFSFLFLPFPLRSAFPFSSLRKKEKKGKKKKKRKKGKKKREKEKSKQHGSKQICSAKDNEDFATDLKLICVSRFLKSKWYKNSLSAFYNHNFKIMERFWQVQEPFTRCTWTALSFHFDNGLLSYPRMCNRIGLLKMNVFNLSSYALIFYLALIGSSVTFIFQDQI